MDMNFSLSLSHRTHEDMFDPKEDMDLVAAINEARTDADLDRVSAMARSRFARRARRQQRHVGTRPTQSRVRFALPLLRLGR